MEEVMQYRKIIAVAALGVLVLTLTPVDMFAVDTNSASAFGGKEISDHADKISKFLFGPVSKFAGMLGAGYGAITAYATSSYKPLLAFAGIGLSIALVPTFINSVFTLLMP
jgi:hypothetical protein